MSGAFEISQKGKAKGAKGGKGARGGAGARGAGARGGAGRQRGKRGANPGHPLLYHLLARYTIYEKGA